MFRTCAVILTGFALACMAQDAKSLRATTEDGRQVVLRGDGTWEFLKTPSQPAPKSTVYMKPEKATVKVKAQFGQFALWIDPDLWREAKSSPGNILLQHTNGQAYAMFISEALSFPADALKEVALLNARKVDPNARLLSEERRVVNGREVLCLEMQSKFQNLPFRYYGYYYGGSSGSMQLVAYTLDSAFAANKEAFTDLLNGLEISDETLPARLAPGPGSAVAGSSEISFNDGAIALSYRTDKWGPPKTEKDGKAILAHVKGAGYAMIIPEKLEVPTDTLPEVALGNARSADPEAKIVFREKRKVNGQEVWCLKMSATPMKGVPLIYYGYYYGGAGGTIQVLTYTSPAQFPDYEADFTELLNTLRVKTAKLPE